MNGELKPCPFCGGEATSFSELLGWDVHGDNEYRAYAGCMNDKCGIGIKLWHTGDDMCDERDDGEETASLLEDKAIAIWNTRAERTCENVHLFSGFRCNECKTTWHTLMRDEAGDWQKTNPKFCPNCGAKVTGAKEVDDER